MLDKCNRINQVLFQDGSSAHLLVTKTSYDVGWRDGFDVDLERGRFGSSKLKVVEVKQSTPVHCLEEVKKYCQDHKIFLSPKRMHGRGIIVNGYKDCIVNDRLEINLIR